MLLVPVIICSEILGRTTNRVTAVYLHYNRRGQSLPEENLNNSRLSDALAVLIQTKTSMDSGISGFKITHYPWNCCGCLCRIMHYWLLVRKKKKKKRKWLVLSQLEELIVSFDIHCYLVGQNYHHDFSWTIIQHTLAIKAVISNTLDSNW